MNELCLLTLSVARNCEDEVVDVLRRPQMGLGELNIVHTHALGSGVHLDSTMEKVRGRAARSVLLLQLKRDALPEVLQALRAALPQVQIRWWIQPLLDSGVIE